MKAITYTEYGGPDVLRFTAVERPSPEDDEVLIRIHAASVNAADWRLLRGKPYLYRIESGLRRPKKPILGADIAGRVEAIGSDVRDFQPGDEVFGDISGCGLGGFAEFVAVPEAVVVSKPDWLTFEEAAAVPMAGVTALQGLRDHGRIHSDQSVLIHGASGGVGTLAVQIAKSFGTEVTGVCSTSKVDLVRSIGAAHVIDYTREDFTRNGQQYDLIFDAVGNRSVSDYKRALSPHGTCVIAGFSTWPRWVEQMVVGTWASRTGSRKIGFMGAKPNRADLIVITELLEADEVVPVIDRRYPLRETAEAIRYLEEGRARGKVIVTVGPGRETTQLDGGD